jgi:hypothetical protein
MGPLVSALQRSGMRPRQKRGWSESGPGSSFPGRLRPGWWVLRVGGRPPLVAPLSTPKSMLRSQRSRLPRHPIDQPRHDSPPTQPGRPTAGAGRQRRESSVDRSRSQSSRPRTSASCGTAKSFGSRLLKFVQAALKSSTNATRRNRTSDTTRPVRSPIVVTSRVVTSSR